MTDPRDLNTVRALLDRHRKELMEKYQAEGVGVGRQDDGHVIVVYVKSAKQRPREAVYLDGVPLKFEVTGPFTTQAP